jgi:membrane protease YdiL (CAAX protease family)
LFGRSSSIGAWTALALGSALPAILWREVAGEHPPLWLPGLQALTLAVAFLALRNSSPLAGFVLALLALQVGLVAVGLIRDIPSYARWASGAPEYQDVFVGSIVLLVPGLLMLLSAVAGGLGRRELFLQRGDPAAPSRIPGTGRRVSWRRLGPLLVILFVAPLAVALTFGTRPDFARLDNALALLPLALAFAAINALSEELRFRCVLLARLVPVVGAETSLWMTALLFGVAHWAPGNNPSGLGGVAMTTVAGLALAKSMLETRGLFWAWTMHGAVDVVIFAFLVMEG